MSEDHHDAHRSIGRRFHILHKRLQQYFTEELGDLDINTGQFPLLMALYHNDGITQEDLTGRVHVDKATTARGVKKLEKLGYLTRERDPDDHRAYKLHLTKKALDLAPRLKSTLVKATNSLTSGLTDEEEQTLMLLLDKMIDSTEENAGNEGDGAE